MTRAAPDRLCVDRDSPHFDAAALAACWRVTLDGVPVSRVFEYCISEGWLRRYAVDANGLCSVVDGELQVERLEGLVAAWPRGPA